MKTRTTYTPAPEVPQELRSRYELVLGVLSGALTVSEAARRLGMSRNRFQTLMHRGLEGLLERLAPGTPGRPSRPAREVELEAELARVTREKERLQERAAMTERLMATAGEFLRGRPATQRTPRARRTKAPPKAGETSEDDGQGELLQRARRLQEIGGRREWTAQVLGVSVSTVRRWAGASAARAPRTRARAVSQETALEVKRHVRELRGLVGAAALTRLVAGVSRRQAERLKREALGDLERERVRACERIKITYPGVLRGFDAMEIRDDGNRAWLLVSADGCVPYRTSAPIVQRYDGAAVARALDADFRTHGAPLVVRMDRASAHGTPEVRSILAAHGVMILHGPPRYPRFYGQLERQNREHRAWWEAGPHVPHKSVDDVRDAMLSALNGRWPRRSLAWKTAADAWRERPALAIDRTQLQAEVRRMTARLIAGSTTKTMTRSLAQRLAIEHALQNRGLLKRVAGIRC